MTKFRNVEIIGQVIIADRLARFHNCAVYGESEGAGPEQEYVPVRIHVNGRGINGNEEFLAAASVGREDLDMRRRGLGIRKRSE